MKHKFMGKIMKKSVFFVSAFILSFLFFSCIGLGETIDQTAPSVAITDPSPRENVPSSFSVSGTAHDNTAVTRLVLTVAGNTWEYDSGNWTKNGNATSDGVWEDTGSGDVKWTVKQIGISEDGEYTVYVTVYDANGNTSAESVAQRTVVYDKQAPKVTITYPEMFKDETKLDEKIVLSETNPHNSSKLPYYINNSFEIKGTQEETFALMFLRAYLEDMEGHIIWKSPLYAAKEKYLQNAIESDYDVFSDAELSTGNYVIENRLRSFKIAVPNLSEVNPGTKVPYTLYGGTISKKTTLKLVTISCDASGNFETEGEENTKTAKITHGVFCYWPQADVPWVDFKMLGDEANAKKYYPGTKLQGYSYDDDGIKSVTAEIKLPNGVVRQEKLYSLPENASANSYQTWEIKTDSTNGKYYMRVVAEDIYGIESEVVEGYFEITDINYPNLEISAPEKDKTIFGDKNGDFTFEISADDDSGVSKVACVYIVNETSSTKYSKGKTEWEKVVSTLPRTDDDGNITWKIDLVEKPKPSSSRKFYEPKTPFTINLFKDLGIDGNKNVLGSQHFIFYVEDNSGNHLITDYTLQGDLDPPEITIDELYVNGTKDPKFSGANYELQGASGKKLKIKGTWSDNSIKAWQDPTKLSYFKVTWNNSTLPVTKEWTSDGGKWEAEFTYTNAYAVGNAATIVASIADYAGNNKSESKGLTVDDTAFELESITSTVASGNYAKGTTIPITLKFNKAVEVTGTPTLTLNNGGTAVYKGTESLNAKFEYIVASGQDTDCLTVTNITGGSFKNGSVSAIVSIEGLNGAKRNLGDNKTIEITTGVPTFKKATLNGDVLELEFSSSIKKNDGTIEITQQNVTKIPPILTELEYNTWKMKYSDLSNYYTKGTNGADDLGNADLSAKYILNFEYDLTNETLIDKYKTAGLDKITIGVKSSKVSVSGAKLLVSLDGSNALPCKGTSYQVKIPAGLVKNVVGTATDKAATAKIKYGGIEKPVIRINKSKWNLNKTDLTATQPLKSKVKIDCETPGVTLKYGYNDEKFPYTADIAGVTLTGSNGVPDAPVTTEGKMPSAPVPAGFKNYTASFDIGENTWENGQKYFIGASAEKNGEREVVYEMAYRSVLVFNEGEKGADVEHGADVTRMIKDFEDQDPDNGVPRAWLRGGDSETGGVTTAGFPLSWDEKDGGKGAALMTKDTYGDDDKKTRWYYVTWELSTTAYLGIMVGITDADSGTIGPSKWAWGRNAWVAFKKWYPLHPGESRLIASDGNPYEYVADKHRGPFAFNTDFTTRSGEKVTLKGEGVYKKDGGGGNTAAPNHDPDNTPISAADAALPGQLLTNKVDLSTGQFWCQDDKNYQTLSDTMVNSLLKSSETTNWQEIKEFYPATLTIKTDSTFTDYSGANFILKSGYYGTIVDSNTTITGATVDNEEKITPTTLSGGTIVITLTADKVKQIVDQNKQIQIMGFGVKIISMTLVPNK